MRDFLVEGGEFRLVGAAAARRVDLLLQLHAPDILLALSKPVAGEGQAAQDERGQAGKRPRAERRGTCRAWRQNARKTAMDPHDNRSNPWGNLNNALCALRICGQCGMNKMVCLTIWQFDAISGAKMTYLQSNLSISGCIIPR
ncbi:hypothetical protein AUC68_08645 [Methyloceanibacter methanicus]|uniref:Uncharacterized protein n=1 Tax=Methyloceanibacter methanicus TaxID=1774968 RepID=A0A1E3W002_9HYPH|nr:hypothetical protein [Methyloceanibacter methanicus]ODR98486.1 hypothetical protein AUC68_08645 [Methyloceanibacter methanicus]